MLRECSVKTELARAGRQVGHAAWTCRASFLIIEVLPSVDEHVQCDIYRMASLLRLSFAQIGNTGKTRAWRMAPTNPPTSVIHAKHFLPSVIPADQPGPRLSTSEHAESLGPDFRRDDEFRNDRLPSRAIPCRASSEAPPQLPRRNRQYPLERGHIRELSPLRRIAHHHGAAAVYDAAVQHQVVDEA